MRSAASGGVKLQLGASMRAISLVTMLEQIAAEKEGKKNLSGNIENFEALMAPENLKSLESAADAFAYLAFHPGADTSVRKYVEDGTLGSDSGPRILTLFTLGERATFPRVVNDQSFGSWMQVDMQIHPAYQMVQWLFEGHAAPPLPGVALFPSLVGDHEVTYVPLDAAKSSEAIRKDLRQVFALAQAAAEKDDFAKQLGFALQSKKIGHVSSGRRSIREMLLLSVQTAGDHISDLVAIAKLAI
jgi:hypothetical protein